MRYEWILCPGGFALHGVGQWAEGHEVLGFDVAQALNIVAAVLAAVGFFIAAGRTREDMQTDIDCQNATTYVRGRLAQRG